MTSGYKSVLLIFITLLAVLVFISMTAFWQGDSTLNNPAMHAIAADVQDDSAFDSKTLTAERCTVCHSSKKYESLVKNREDWTKTVDRMISNGAKLSAQEQQTVIEYLVNK